MIKQRLYKSALEGSIAGTQYIRVPSGAPELLECPCCGGRAVYKSLHAIWIECTVCGLSTPAYTDISIAAVAWNGSIQAVDLGKDGIEDIGAVGLESDRTEYSRDNSYNGVLTRDELDEALRLKQSRAEGKPILVRPRVKKKKPRGRPMNGDDYAPKYVPTGRPPGRPRKQQNDN